MNRSEVEIINLKPACMPRRVKQRRKSAPLQLRHIIMSYGKGAVYFFYATQSIRPQPVPSSCFRLDALSHFSISSADIGFAM